MIKLGYSLGQKKPKYSLKERIEILLSVENYAVEVSYIVAGRLDEKLDTDDIKKIKQFDYISIHAPALTTEDPKVWLRYPSAEGKAVIEDLLKIAKDINANTILFHPDLVDDFKWLNDKVGNLLAFENMDVHKSFGKTVEDLKSIFKQAPQAKWVCDVNHLYTIDQSMELAEEFHKNFQNKLCHYHLSGYGGFHEALHISQEDIILKGIKDFSIPIINEGSALRDGKTSLLKENDYILDRLKQKFGH
ncbi:MAG: hypothetical protein WCV73_00350 [Patescibacteria group bacterium]|jgi:hypothetical protein